MRINLFQTASVIAVAVLVSIFLLSGSAIAAVSIQYPQQQQQQPSPPQELKPLPQQEKEAPKVSDEEAKAAKAIEDAPSAQAKLTAAGEFVKKYPKSTIREQVARYLVEQIAPVTDASQKLAFVQEYEKTFNAEPELALVTPIKVDAYVAANRIDEAFKAGASSLAKNPDDTHVLIRLTMAGTEEAKQGKPTHVAQALQYGVKAIELLEANKKPAAMEVEIWASHKRLLPQLYQQTAALQMISGKTAEAKARLEKSIALDPKEPTNYVLLGYVINDEYTQLATQYKAMPEGPEKEATIKKIEGMMDNMIELYAQAVGLATGRAEYQALVQQVMPDLTSFYKYRHNQSVDGLQQLIDKYKAEQKP